MNNRTHKKWIKHEKHLQADIKKAFKSGNDKQLKSANRIYLYSYAPKYNAATEVNNDLPARKRLQRDAVVELAKSINVWENCDEPAQLQLKPKPNNACDFRHIFQFGIENQIRQVLVRNALKAQLEYIPNQYLMNGGRDEAIKAVQHHYKQGYKFVQELDVYHCFRSFNMEGVAKYLSLPKEVTAQVLSGSHLRACNKIIASHTF